MNTNYVVVAVAVVGEGCAGVREDLNMETWNPDAHVAADNMVEGCCRTVGCVEYTGVGAGPVVPVVANIKSDS